MLFSLGPITALAGTAGAALAGSRQGELDAINKKNLLMQGQENQWKLNEQDELWADKVKQALATSRLTQQQTAADNSLVAPKTRNALQDLGLQYKIGGAQEELFDRTRDTGIGTGVNNANSAFDTSSQQSQLLQVTQALNDIKANPGKTIANLTALGVAPNAIQGDAITGYKVNGIPVEQFLLGHRQTIMSAALRPAESNQAGTAIGIMPGAALQSSLPAGSDKWTLGGKPVLFSTGTDGIPRVNRPDNMYHGMPVGEFEKVVKGTLPATVAGPISGLQTPQYPNIPTPESYDRALEVMKRSSTSVVPQEELNAAIRHEKVYSDIINKYKYGSDLEADIGSQLMNIPRIFSPLNPNSYSSEDDAKFRAAGSGMENLLSEKNRDLFKYAQDIADNGGKFPESMPKEAQDRFDKDIRNWSWTGGSGITNKRLTAVKIMLDLLKQYPTTTPISNLKPKGAK